MDSEYLVHTPAHLHTCIHTFDKREAGQKTVSIYFLVAFFGSVTVQGIWLPCP